MQKGRQDAKQEKNESSERPTAWAVPPSQVYPAGQAPHEQDVAVDKLEESPGLQVHAKQNKTARRCSIQSRDVTPESWPPPSRHQCCPERVQEERTRTDAKNERRKEGSSKKAPIDVSEVGFLG